MTTQAFHMTDRTHGEVLVEITSCEDRGDFWYVHWRPVYSLDGKSIPEAVMIGAFGTRRFYKDRRYGDTFRRAPVRVHSAPNMGWGVLAGHSV